MSIELSDIAAAVGTYLDTNVTTTISAVTPTKPKQDVLTPGQDGAFSVTVTNASAPEGVKLINVRYHMKISDDTVAKFVAPGGLVLAAFPSLNSTTPIKDGTLVGEMFVENVLDNQLDVGDSDTINLTLHCIKQGDAKATGHIHADVDQSDLFPTSQSPNGEQTVSVL